MVLFINISIITQITRATPTVGQTILRIKTHIRGGYQEATWKKEKFDVDFFYHEPFNCFIICMTFVNLK
jgi:hypothetical protein